MNVRAWLRRLAHRGAHRATTTAGDRESVHAATAAAHVEQAKAREAQQRAAEAAAFMREFRHTFGVGNGGRM